MAVHSKPLTRFDQAPAGTKVLRGVAPRRPLQVRAIAEAARSFKSGGAFGNSGMANAAPAESIKHELAYRFGKRADYAPRDLYNGTAWSVREKLIDSFDKTHDYWA